MQKCPLEVWVKSEHSSKVEQTLSSGMWKCSFGIERMRSRSFALPCDPSCCSQGTPYINFATPIKAACDVILLPIMVVSALHMHSICVVTMLHFISLSMHRGPWTQETPPDHRTKDSHPPWQGDMAATWRYLSRGRMSGCQLQPTASQLLPQSFPTPQTTRRPVLNLKFPDSNGQGMALSFELWWAHLQGNPSSWSQCRADTPGGTSR